jgi:hypothetical protein
MPLTVLKKFVNRGLRIGNLKLDTLTAEKLERDRLENMARRGYFSRPAFSVSDSFRLFSAEPLRAALEAYRADIEKMLQGAPPGRFDANNLFFLSPDVEILYCMVRLLSPARIVEVGSGNSTRVIRQAISDGKLETLHIAIDPKPRADIAGFVDRIHLSRFEDTDTKDLLEALGANDILFVDSSHEVRVANDVVKLFCETIPMLAKGVVVHIHDVWLPFDYPVYPEPYKTACPGWGEQYLLQVMLQPGRHEILWPGYYVQRLRPDLHHQFPFLKHGVAQSFWFRIA